MSSGPIAVTYDRVVERRRAVALARHFCEAEGLSIAQIADRLGRSPATIKAYLYDPTGEKARAVKARYVGVCRGCGAYTQPRNGKGDAYAYCKTCHPGAITRRWTRERVLDAMRDWRARHGRRLPMVAHARRGRGEEALARLRSREWLSASVVYRAGPTRFSRHSPVLAPRLKVPRGRVAGVASDEDRENGWLTPRMLPAAAPVLAWRPGGMGSHAVVLD